MQQDAVLNRLLVLESKVTVFTSALVSATPKRHTSD
jgi:hypothetical protein